jgi:hypothetical protein
LHSNSQTNGCPLRHNLTPTLVRIDQLKRLGRETRRHPKAQIAKLVANLEEFGFVAPIVTDRDYRVVAGAALLLAARELHLTEVPVVQIHELTEVQLRALRIALNRLLRTPAGTRRSCTSSCRTSWRSIHNSTCN